MDTTLTKSEKRPNEKNVATGRIFFLDLGGGRVLSANPDGSDLKTIVVEGRKFPDGWPSISPPDIYTGPTWETSRRTMASSSVRISTGKT
jgi:hypothetical protein